jgi:hypothetical protein
VSVSASAGTGIANYSVKSPHSRVWHSAVTKAIVIWKEMPFDSWRICLDISNFSYIKHSIVDG